MAELQFDFLTIPIPDFVCGVGVFSVALCYLMGSLCFPVFWDQRDINECRHRVKRRRKFGTHTGQRTCQREAQERRKLLSILKSRQSQHHDIIHFRHLLCPDPLCEVCNRASTMVHHLLLQESLDDASSADSSSSTASVTESSFTETSTISDIHPGDSIPYPSSDSCPLPTSVISPKPVTPLSDFLSVSSRSDSLSPQPIYPSSLKFPEDHSPPRPLALFDSSTHASQGTDSVVHPEATLPVTGNPDESCTHIPSNSSTEPSSVAMSRLCQWQAPSRNVLLPRLQHCDSEQENASSHSPRSCFCRDFDATNIDASSLLLLGLNVKTLSERQLRKEMTFQISEMKENATGTFSNQMGLEHCLTSSGNSLLSLAHEQAATATKPGWDTEGKLEPLCLCQQLLYVKNLGESLKQQYRQLFWGLPSLHSESLVATVLLSNGSSSLEPHFVLFNGICSGLIVQTQDPKPPPLPRVHTLPLTHLHSQYFPQNHLQPQFLPPAHAHSRIHFHYPLTILPSSSAQIQSHKAAFHRFQSGADSHLPNQHLECFQKPESLWKLVPRHQTHQELPCSPDSNFPSLRQSSQTPVSVFPGHFHVNNGHRGQLELQVSMRQAPYCCVRVNKNAEFAALMEPQFDSMDTARLDCRHAHSPHSEFQGHRSEDSGNTELMTSRNFHERVHTQCQLRKDMTKNLANTLGTYSLDNPPTMSECYQGKSQRAAAETKYAWMWYSRNDSMNELQRVSRNNLNENQIKSILRLHLTRKFWQIIENRIPLLVCHSWLATNDRLSASQNCHSNTENEHSALMLRGCQINPFVLSFLHPKTQQMLEAHIIRFQLNQKWGLPLKVLESIKIFTMREAKTWVLPQLDNPLSTVHISGKDSKAEKISQPFHGDKVETISPVLSPNSSLLATSPKGQEEQESPRQSSFETNSVQSENDQKSSVESGTEISMSSSHSIISEKSQKQTVGVRQDSPEQPTVQDEAEHNESRNGRVRFSDQSDTVAMFQESKMEDTDSEHLSIPNIYEEVFKAQELPVSPLQDTNGQTATNSQMKTMNPNQATASDCCPLSILKEPILSPPKEQLLRELKFKLQSRDHGQSPGCSSDPSFTADSWTTDSSRSESHSAFSEDITDSQVHAMPTAYYRGGKGAFVALHENLLRPDLVKSLTSHLQETRLKHKPQ
ncbi:spermatogenesis-associated protein 31D3-like [Ochotona princeps]|uniref:spermatogenesis-associated protein 31D3-like n=1 Tax=Ochotona princeps TaxID=9978 RepID=UPI00271454C6|nr:spermatogenesis-associated protein 31D3-like [Ochotona princeps]